LSVFESIIHLRKWYFLHETAVFTKVFRGSVIDPRLLLGGAVIYRAPYHRSNWRVQRITLNL
ncbi:hypothetical protein, partial [Sulfitobacter sp. HI0054]|uniref:hypothetical protein n=1 Tax=Sulfitobacter sp. HI0054 TaxID=1822238 RepID=UPI000A922FD7